MTKEKESFFKSSFFIRTRSGIILVLLILFLLLKGGNVLLAGLGVISLIGLQELYRVMDIHNKLLGCVGYLLTVLYYLHMHFTPNNNDQLVFLFIVMLVLVLAVYVLSFPAYGSEQMMTAFFGLFYVPVMLSYIYQCRILDGGVYLVWLVLPWASIRWHRF